MNRVVTVSSVHIIVRKVSQPLHLLGISDPLAFGVALLLPLLK